MESEIDIAVIGAGPAGLMASTLAARAGARVSLLDGRSWAGGRLGLQMHRLQGPRTIFRGRSGVELCRLLLDGAAATGAEILLESTVTQLRPVPSERAWVGLRYVSADGEENRLEAKAVVLAAGSREPSPRFPGATLPGVIPAGDVQSWVTIHGALPGRRMLVSGSDDAGLLTAANMRAAGIDVVAVADESPTVAGRDVNLARLRDAGVPVLTSHKIVAAGGSDAVESVTVARVDSAGVVMAGTERSIEVDTICLAGPRVPESRLAALAGCILRDVGILGGLVPVHDRWMETTVAGLYVCGDGAGVENGAVSLESGRLAGLRAARAVGCLHPQADAEERLARGRLGYLRRGRRGLLRRRARSALVAAHRGFETVSGKG